MRRGKPHHSRKKTENKLLLPSVAPAKHFLDGTLVDAAALVNKVTGGRRLSGIDVADNNQVNVNLLLTHGCSKSNRREGKERHYCAVCLRTRRFFCWW